MKLGMSLSFGILILAMGLGACEGGESLVVLDTPRCVLKPVSVTGQPLSLSDSDFSLYLRELAIQMSDQKVSGARFNEVRYDTHPLRKVQFVVRVTDSSGAPIKNTPVMYSFRKKDEILFSEPLSTDADGFLVFTQEQPKEVKIAGGSYSSTQTTSDTVSLSLGPLKLGSTTSSSTTLSGFGLTISESVPPIVLEGEYEGLIQVAGAKIGAPDRLVVNSRITNSQKELMRLPQNERIVRMGRIAHLYDSCSASGDACGQWSEGLGKSGLVFRSGIDAPFSCAAFEKAVGAAIESHYTVSYESEDGAEPGDCKTREKMLTALTCDSDWVETVWENHVLE